MKKTHLFGAIIGFLVFPLCLCTVILANREKAEKTDVRAGSGPYSVTLNSAAFGMSSLTTTYQQSVTQNFGEDRPVMNYFLAKKDGSNNLVLAPAGKVFNYSSSVTYKGRVTNITSITVNYSGGALYVQEGLNGGAEVYGKKTAITSGSELDLISSPNHIMISNSVAETTITSMIVKYSCSEAGFIVERLGEKYNGKSAEGGVYVLERNGTNVSFAGQTGTISVDALGNFNISLLEGAIVYTGMVSSDYKTLTFTGKNGAGAGSAPTIAEMNRIYVMDDFESYTVNGTGYTSNPSHASAQSQVFVTSATASDLRASYYSDYGGGGNNTWIVGSSFQVPTSSDYLNLTTAAHHGGLKAMTIKGSTGGWMRYWSREIFDQNQHYNFGSGDKLSFWAHGAYTNTTCTTSSADRVEVRANVYYENFEITDSNRNGTTYGTGVKTLYVEAGSDWTEYAINIDPTKKVYAVNLMINNSGLSKNVYLPVDDITIYTTPVYQPTKKYNESATKITKSYHGTVNLSIPFIGNKTFSIKVGLGANGYIYAYCGENMEPTGYTITGSIIVITTEGDYNGNAFGTWTGTLSNNNSTITIPVSGITGSGVSQYITNDPIVLNEDSVLASGNEGNSTLQAMFTKQYNNSGWITESGDNVLTQNTNYFIQGNNSIAVKGQAYYSSWFFVNPAIVEAQGKDIESVSFWYYVPAETNLTVRLYFFSAYSPDSGSSDYIQKNYANDGTTPTGWQYINCGFPNGYKKNFAIFFSNSAAPLMVDYITYF